MMQTFNCGVGFCLIAPKKMFIKIKSFFSKGYLPYEIGYISDNKKKVNLSKKIKKLKKKIVFLYLVKDLTLKIL